MGVVRWQWGAGGIDCAHRLMEAAGELEPRATEATGMDLEAMQELQQVDLQRDEARRRLEGVVAQITEHPYIAALNAELEAQTQAAAQAAATGREAAAAVEQAQRRIEAADERLYGGSITNPRTLTELQSDLYAQRQKLVELQDTELASRQQAEEAFGAERWLRQLRERSLEIWNARQSELAAQRDTAQQRMDALTAQVEEHRRQLREADLEVYDEYRSRRPRVVAAVAGGVCEECRLALPTMVITRARRSIEPIECPSCGCLVRVA